MYKAIVASTLAAALLVASVSAASAWDDRHDYRDDHRGPVLGFAGDVLAGAFKIATFPLALLADLGRDGRHDGYYEEGAYPASPEMARDYYGSGARYYGPPPRYEYDRH